MEPTIIEKSVDYSDKLNKIIDLLTKLNDGTQAIYSMFYILLVVGSVILLCILFYKFLKIFI